MRLLSYPAICILIVLVVGISLRTHAQAEPRPAMTPQTHVTSSPAYAELLLRRTEVESDLEALVLEYTDEFPAVVNLKQHLLSIQKEIGLLSKVKAADAGRLTLALGKLMVKRAELQAAHTKLLSGYKEEHPDVKRAKRRIEIYDKAIKDILG
ncbi:hypothetical protein BH24ACI3_BH24ACI3_01390 [soil metagenome]